MPGEGQYHIYSHSGTSKGYASTPGGAVKRPSSGGGIWGPLEKRMCVGGGSGGSKSLSGGVNGGVNGGLGKI
ncbi:hypothetical protein [Orf virus]|uniref:Orf virus homologue of retroviral pseudoprotease protein n=2 Tax=Orf virus TaxID=10258 RepID=Q85298_ORFV|nr:ORF1 [Orf virus]AAR98101.1 ORF005 hypothetical protein [Orf virus]ABA00522.1 hypothetical protein [Orf virus]WIF30100.1 hypothetical protein [Orf virus]